MIVRICAFTDRGRELARRLTDLFVDDIVDARESGEDLREWTRTSFELKAPTIFIGACGIVVRAIAPFVEDKLTDSPVVVCDEAGRFVVPLLSGHLGGANELARFIAEALGATSVVTTATDVNGVFAVDVFAKKNELRICDRVGIRKVSSVLLSGKRIKVSVAPYVKIPTENPPQEIELVEYPPRDRADVLVSDDARLDDSAVLRLEPKRYALGIGCKRGTPAPKIEALAVEAFGGLCGRPLWDYVFAVGSVDLKKKERGLVEFAQRLHLPLRTYSADELNAVSGDFSESEFVKETVGVGNVCERAAIKCAGKDAVTIVKKTCRDGVTFAAAQRMNYEIKTWLN